MHDDTGKTGRRPVLVTPPEGRASTRPAHRSARARDDDAPRRSSSLGGRVQWLEAIDRIAELFDDQLVLSMNVAGLERTAAAGSGRAADAAAKAVFAEHVRQLGVVRDALARLLFATGSHRVHRAFLPIAPLAEYVRGVYAWTLAVCEALDELALAHRWGIVDWGAFHARVEIAANLHFDQLEEEVVSDLRSLRTGTQQETAVECLERAFSALLAAARRLETQLDLDR